MEEVENEEESFIDLLSDLTETKTEFGTLLMEYGTLKQEYENQNNTINKMVADLAEKDRQITDLSNKIKEFAMLFDEIHRISLTAVFSTGKIRDMAKTGIKNG